MAFTPWGRRREQQRHDQLAAVITEQVTKALAPVAAGAKVVPTPPVVDPTGLAETTNGTYPAMPRLQDVFGGPFGPGMPLRPAAIDPAGPFGRPDPRLAQYDPTRNLNLEDRTVPFTLLRSLADQCDIVRRCIEIRKAGITGLDWHFTITDQVIAQVMAETGEQNQAKAAAVARDKYAAEIDRLNEFWAYPDRRNGYTWSEWLGLFLEEHFVIDAVAIWPHPTLAGDLHSLEILDGTTIKPLLDRRGARPEPPSPAFQQILWGFPRGEFIESSDVDAEFSASDLYYAVRNRRPFTPYGFSVVEQAIPSATLWLERQAWLKAEYSEGSLPQSVIKVTPGSHGENWTPDQRAQYEVALNDELAGNTSQRMRMKLLFPGMEIDDFPRIDEKYKPDYDENLIKRIGSIFGVMPTQLGIIPRTGIGGRGQQEGEQDQSESMSQKPDIQWLTDVVNEISSRFLKMPPELTVKIDDGGTNRHQVDQATVLKAAVSTGWQTLNDVRGELGLPLFDMPEADAPMIITPTGPIFLKDALATQLAPPPPPPAPVIVQHPGVPSTPVGNPGDKPAEPAKPAEPSAPEDPQESQQSEGKKFLAYARNRQGRAWRDFQFTSIPDYAGVALNKAGATGDLEQVRQVVVDLGKAHGRSEDRPAHHAEQRILTAYTPLLGAGVRALFDPEKAARLAYQSASVLMKKHDPDGLSGYIRRLLNQLTPDQTDLRHQLLALLTASYVAGRAGGARQAAEKLGREITGQVDVAAVGMRWGDWKPGDPLAAAKLAVDDPGSGLSGMLQQADVTIQGMADTTLDRMSTSLADSLSQGLSVDGAASALGDVLDDPARAWLIADTEMCRAVSTATQDAYTANGIPAKSWMTIDNPCPICTEAADEGVIPVGDSFTGVGVRFPPGHPRCRCTLVPELDTSSPLGGHA